MHNFIQVIQVVILDDFILIIKIISLKIKLEYYCNMSMIYEYTEF